MKNPDVSIEEIAIIQTLLGASYMLYVPSFLHIYGGYSLSNLELSADEMFSPYIWRLFCHGVDG